MRCTTLKKLGVKVKSAVPGIGEKMQDHNAMAIVYGTTNTLVGDTPFATFVTAQDVLGNKTAWPPHHPARSPHWA
jgi:choline dehydrogenase